MYVIDSRGDETPMFFPPPPLQGQDVALYGERLVISPFSPPQDTHEGVASSGSSPSSPPGVDADADAERAGERV
jgi:hypothetical protein